MPRKARTATPGTTHTLTGMTIQNGDICLPFAQPGITITNGLLRLSASQVTTYLTSRMIGGAGTTGGTTGPAPIKRRGRPAGTKTAAKVKSAVA